MDGMGSRHRSQQQFSAMAVCPGSWEQDSGNAAPGAWLAELAQPKQSAGPAGH